MPKMLKISVFQFVYIVLLSLIIFSILPINTEAANDKISIEVKSRLHENEKVHVIIILKDKKHLESLSIENRIHSLKNHSFESQKGLSTFLEEEKINGNADRINPFWIVNAIALKASPQLIVNLEKHDDIESIQLDHQFHTVENDFYTTSMVMNNPTSDLVKINATEVWKYGIYGSGINVSIIDTGINYLHPDIAGRLTRFKDLVYNLEVPYDDDGHGTHVAGTVGGNGAGGITTGVAPNVSLFGVKVFDRNGVALESRILDGMQWSIDNNANIISMSLAGDRRWTTSDCDLDDPAMAGAINNAIAAGVIVVAAAGNHPSGGIPLPGCIRNATVVGAVDGSNDLIASFSGRGAAMADHGVVAPGVGITSLYYLTTGYIQISGTSMATPHVAGTYALMLEAAKRKGMVLTPLEARSILMGTSKDLGATGIDTTYGAGRIDAFEAINGFIMGYVNGTVVDSVTQQGISGATVTTNTSITTTTNGTGYYSLHLIEGAYGLTVTSEPEYYTNSSVIVRATNDPDIMQVIEIEIKPTGNITGRIQNSAAGG